MFTAAIVRGVESCSGACLVDRSCAGFGLAQWSRHYGIGGGFVGWRVGATLHLFGLASGIAGIDRLGSRSTASVRARTRRHQVRRRGQTAASLPAVLTFPGVCCRVIRRQLTTECVVSRASSNSCGLGFDRPPVGCGHIAIRTRQYGL